MRNLYLLAAFFVAPLLGFGQTQYTLNTGHRGVNMTSTTIAGSTTDNTCVQLTPASPCGIQDPLYYKGSVFSNTMVNLNQNFDVNAKLYFGNQDGGGDGIAFVLQAEGTSYIGNDGAGIGYHRFNYDNPGPVPSFIVEFDTYQNATDWPQLGDPAGDHVGFMSYSNAYHINTTTALQAPTELSGNIEDGAWHDAHFVWNASTHTMTVTFATSTGTTQTFSYTGDIVNTIFGGNSNVYWGFTASNGSYCPNEHKVCIVPPPSPTCGQLRTQTPGGWGAPPHGDNPGAYLLAHFASVFPSGLTVGLTSGGYSVKLTSAAAIEAYLPAGGKAAKLTMNYTNPATTDLKNTLVDHLVALTLSVKFDAADPNFAPSGVTLGNMIIGSGPFAGWTVNNFLTEANKVLGGGTSTYTVQQVLETASAINESYVDGTTDKGYLKCPTTTPSGRTERPVTVLDMPANQLRVQPNPSAGQFEVALGQLQGGTAQLLITNTNGSIVERRMINGAAQGATLRVDLSRYAAGLYMVKLITASGEQNQKVLIQK